MARSTIAASTAPRDAFFRKPGFTTQNMPASAHKLEVEGTTFWYDRGVFFRQLPNGFIAVTPPVGAVVNYLPEHTGAAVVDGDAETYFYYFGAFFKAEGDKFKTVTPPNGTLVGYVPDGYTESGSEDDVRYQFGDTTFKAVFFQRSVIYQVVSG